MKLGTKGLTKGVWLEIRLEIRPDFFEIDKTEAGKWRK